MAEPFKICPICETANHRNATMCVTCGTSLADVSATNADKARAAVGDPTYDYRYGETDLLEDALRKKGRAYLFAIVSVLLVGMALGAVLIAAPLLSSMPGNDDTLSEQTQQALDFSTNTPPPTLALATVTEGPPTLTPSFTPSLTPTVTLTPTREPCFQTVGAGEGLYALVSRCGHRDLAVIDEVLRLNNLNDANSILAGQVIEIPWPTETPDPNAGAGESFNGTGDASAEVAVSFGLSEEDIAATQAVDPFFVPTPTNPPGIENYEVQPGDNITTIILAFNTNIEVIEQLNPQVTFSQCDFGTRFGGERCIVLLAPSQLIRVPAPTPTPTLSPTPSGSETPTPTATATFNAPYAVSPSNRAYFRRDEFVTLRWASSGILDTDDVYQITVENLTTRERYSAESQDLFFVVPSAWQGTDAVQYEYEWTVGIINPAEPEVIRYPTDPLKFTWEGRGN